MKQGPAVADWFSIASAPVWASALALKEGGDALRQASEGNILLLAFLGKRLHSADAVLQFVLAHDHRELRARTVRTAHLRLERLRGLANDGAHAETAQARSQVERQR